MVQNGRSDKFKSFPTWHVGREDVLVEDDEVLDELVDEGLELHLVSLLRDGHEGGPEADGQVVRVHEVLVGELAQVVEEGEEVAHHDEDRPGPSLDHVADLDHELVLRLKLWKEKNIVTILISKMFYK